MIIIFCIFCISWITCGILIYGINFAYWQRKYPLSAKDSYTTDKTDAIMMGIALGLLGIIGLLIIYFDLNCGKYGLKFK